MALTQLLDQNGWAYWRTVHSTSPNSTVAVGLPRSGYLKMWGIGLAKCFERLLKRTHNMSLYEVKARITLFMCWQNLEDSKKFCLGYCEKRFTKEVTFQLRNL